MKSETIINEIVPEPNSALVLMRSITVCSLLLSGIFVVGSWLLFDWHFAGSVLVGATLVMLSFYLLKRDIGQFVNRVAGEDVVETAQGFEKIKFMLKFYARLTVLGLLLAVLILKFNINVIGLIIGLSIIVLTIVIVGVVKGRQIFSLQKVEGV